MKVHARISYQTTTEESAKDGDFWDNGFYKPRGWYYSVNDESVREDFRNNPEAYDLEVETIEELADVCRDLGITNIEGDNLVSLDPVHDRKYFEKGFHTTFTLHLDCETAEVKKAIMTLIANLWEGFD